MSNLEYERDQLLKSLDDLEAERAAGDLTDDDYERLRDTYTAQAADVMRRLGDGGPTESGTETGSATDASAGPSGSGLARRAIVIGCIALFGLVAGWALARALGERGVNDELTGGIDASTRSQVARCQELGAGGGDLVGSLECFDDVLARDPENAEALAYRGWYLLLAAGSIQQGGDAEQQDDADELVASGLTYLDRAIGADPTYPDPLAFRATVFDRLGQSDEACADIATLRSLDPPQFFLDQTTPIADRNACP